MKNYETLNEETGEVTSKILYSKGLPKEYRFNGQTGKFNIDGEIDKGTTLELVPLAWRVFEAELFGRGRVDLWAEIFFIDDESCVSAIMFNNTSVQILQKAFAKLVYQRLTLSEVKMKISTEQRKNEKAKSTYHVAVFEFEKADPDFCLMMQEFALDFPIYRADTVTDSQVQQIASKTYFEYKKSVEVAESNN